MRRTGASGALPPFYTSEKRGVRSRPVRSDPVSPLPPPLAWFHPFFTPSAGATAPGAEARAPRRGSRKGEEPGTGGLGVVERGRW